MADAIREYVIKIRAEVKDALAQIDQLKGKFDKIEIKAEVDKSLGRQIESLGGSIGKITKEMGNLNASFKEADFKSFTDDMRSSFDDLKNSINEIKDSAKTLSEAFDFSGKGENGFTSFINDFKQQMQDFLSSYKDVAGQISELQDKGFISPKSKPTPPKKESKPLLDFSDFEEAQAQALEAIDRIAATQKEIDIKLRSLVSNPEIAMETGREDELLPLLSDVEALDDALKIIKNKSDKVNQKLREEIGIPVREIHSAKKNLQKQVDTSFKNVEQQSGKPHIPTPPIILALSREPI